MDLFGDLPEPSSGNPTNSSASLYDSIPASSNTSSLSLYDDLPTQSTPAKSTNIPSLVPSMKRKSEGTPCVIEKKLKSVKYEIDSYLAERQGEREDMQDAHIIIQDFTSEIPDLHPEIYRVSLYGVFDGHGGIRASRFASQNLHKNLRDKFPKGGIDIVERDIKKLFIDAFKKTDDDFLKQATKVKPVWKDGTTAILVLIINENMYIANIGDSQAVLCRVKDSTTECSAVPLSVPHNPSIYEERMRIQKQGGHVKDGRVMGVLEVSRSIGDGQYKKLGVTCTPDVKKCSLTDNDRYVIIACDGLWKCFEPSDSIKFVNKIVEENKDKDVRVGKNVKNNKYDIACNQLANEAVLRFSGDNVTVLLLAIRKCR
ncbi:hypothetical protein ACF0H5_019300 [Mactra antiquata]